MSRRARDKRLVDHRAREVFATLLVFVWAAATGCGSQAKELRIQASAVESASAEGQVLAIERSRGRSPVRFTRVHARRLSAQVSGVVEALGKRPLPRELAVRARQLRAIAVESQGEILEVAGNSRNSAELKDAARELSRLAEKASWIAARLRAAENAQ